MDSKTNKDKENKIYTIADDNKTDPLQQQYLDIKKLSFFRKIITYLKLSKKQKEKLKKFLQEQKRLLNNPKESFDPHNIFEIDNFNLWYLNGNKQALFNINMAIKKNRVTAMIGPSGCGKSTFLRSLNRINDEIEGLITYGNIYYNKINIRSKKMPMLELRCKVGMIFQKPSPFNMSIYDNVAYGLRSHGIKDKKILDEIVIQSLKDAALYDEVKDELDKLGTELSGGQQQRLCIARVIAMSPEVILMDEPTSALDPIATSKIEELIYKLKNKFTIILVTHSMTQAQRVSDYAAFFYKGHLVEFDKSRQLFTKPKNKLTYNYIIGKMG
ncbi:phosphate ABC transporter ATP-binding protein [bacterium]|nr:phosphate ABC transporter ATP-binding protein [bacterium]